MLTYNHEFSCKALALALGNKVGRKEAKSLPKFKDILGKRTLNEEEEDIPRSWLHFYKYYAFVVIQFIIDVIFLCYEQKPNQFKFHGL